MRFEVACPDEAVLDLAEGALSALQDPRPGPAARYSFESVEDGWLLRFEGARVGPLLTDRRLLPTFITDLNRRAAASTREHLVLHAGVVAPPGRPAIIFAGPSGAGKSTLVASALERGWSYGGDEHAALRHHDRTLDPFPKPLALKAGSRENFEKYARRPEGVDRFFDYQLLLSAERLGAAVLPGGQPVGAVVLPCFREGSEPELEPVGGSAALVALRSEAFNWAIDPPAAFETLTCLVRSAPVYRLQFGHASSALSLLEATESERLGLNAD